MTVFLHLVCTCCWALSHEKYLLFLIRKLQLNDIIILPFLDRCPNAFLLVTAYLHTCVFTGYSGKMQVICRVTTGLLSGPCHLKYLSLLSSPLCEVLSYPQQNFVYADVL